MIARYHVNTNGFQNSFAELLKRELKLPDPVKIECTSSLVKVTAVSKCQNSIHLENNKNKYRSINN